MIIPSIKVSINDIAVVPPMSMEDGDLYTIHFKDRDVVLKVMEQLETIILETEEE